MPTGAQERIIGQGTPLSYIIAEVSAKHGNVITEADRIPPPAPALALFTFEDFKSFHREFHTGSISFASYCEQFERLLTSRESLKTELRSKFNAKQLAVLASRMRYTHVGLADQAKTLAALPATEASDAGQHIGRIASHSTCDVTSRRGTDTHNTQSTTSNGTTGEQRTSGTTWQNKTGDGDRSHHP